MAIRSSGALGIREILSDIDGNPSSRADLIGLGVVVGASAGVIGGGDNVIMPGDFYGEEISLTATAATFSTTAYTFPNTGGTLSVTISNLNGIYRLSNVPSWSFVTPTYGTTSSTTITIGTGNNSMFGASAHSASSIQLLGSGNTVLASISIQQAGNPVVFDWTGGNASAEYAAGTVTNKSIEASSVFTVTVSSSNTNLATVSVGTATGTNPKDHPVTITHFENFQTGSAQSCQITGTGTATEGTLSKTISFTQNPYDSIKWLGTTATISDTASTISRSFTGATSVNQVSGGHPFTISIIGAPSWISVSPSSGTYSPIYKFNGNAGTTSVTFTYSSNTTGSSRSAIALVTDTNSGHTHNLILTQPAQELSLFDIDSGESDPHILNLPLTAVNPQGWRTWALSITANGGFANDWEIEGTTSGANNPYTYDTTYLQHKKSTDSTWTAIDTALTGNGNATIEIRNPLGTWKSFDNNMSYPYYRFRSDSYPSDYTQTVTINQPKNIIDFDLVMSPDVSVHPTVLANGGDTDLTVYSNTNLISLYAYASNGTGLTIAATIGITGTGTTTNLFTAPGTTYANSNWSSHPNSTQIAAGRTFAMSFIITNSYGSTDAILSNQWCNFYVRATSQSQSEGTSSGGYSKLFIEKATSGGGTPPGPPGPGPGPGPKGGGGIE